MKRRIIWLVVSGLMALSLVLASCAPKVTEEKKEVVTEKKEVVTEKKEVVTEKKEVVTEKEGAEMVTDALGRLVPKPQYGGVLKIVEESDPYGFSRSVLNRTFQRGYLTATNEPLLMKNRLRGPAATVEWYGGDSVYAAPELYTGHLAESWEVIQPDTLIFKIRKGIRWQDKAPVYGSELTAEDVAYTFLARWAAPGSSWPRAYRDLSNLANPEKSIYVNPDDPGAVVFKSAPGVLGTLWERVANYDVIVPKALGPIAGEGFVDWKGVVGTGPFLLTDYVSGASLTYERNPNYWKKDVFHPQNQLPYLDGVQLFIIADLSTQMAALRTGKLDIISGVDVEEWESLMRSNPELKSREKWGSAGGLAMRNDVAPFNDVRVRRAMMMATNFDELVNDYFGGKAMKFYWPAYPVAETKSAFVPLEEMPESVKELYTYNPDKAKKLLAEAGYPNGFTTSITMSNAAEENIDLASVVAAYWTKVGVTLKLDLKEPAVLNAMTAAFSYPHGTWSGSSASEANKFTFSRVGSNMNYARINDPLLEATYQAVVANYFNRAEADRINREAMPKLQELALRILLPLRPDYTMWQPWVGGYHGELTPQHIQDFNTVTIVRYVWIDQKLKKAMGR